MTAVTESPVVPLRPEVIEQTINIVRQQRCQRLSPADVRSILADMCEQLHCRQLDLPDELIKLGVREVNTSKSDFVNVLLEVRFALILGE